MKKLMFVMPLMVAISLLASCNSSKTDNYITVNSGLGCFEDKTITKKFKIGSNPCLEEVINYVPTYAPVIADSQEAPITKPIYCFTDDKNNQIVELNDNAYPGMELTCHYFPSYDDYHSFCVGEISRYYGAATSKCGYDYNLLENHNSILDLYKSMDSIDYMYIQEGLRIALSMGYDVAARCILAGKGPGFLDRIAAVLTYELINNHLSIGLGEAYMYLYDCVGETGKGLSGEGEFEVFIEYISAVHPNAYLALSRAFSVRYAENKKNFMDNHPALEGNASHLAFEEIFYKGLIAAKDDFDCLTAIGDTCSGYYYSLADAVGDSDEESANSIVTSFKKAVDDILESK